jgi:alpha-tubulin suppressor-like RCC1 family protein
MDNTLVNEVAMGYDHSAILSQAGSLYIWGDNSKSQLGFDSMALLTKEQKAAVIATKAAAMEKKEAQERESRFVFLEL